MPIRVSVVIAMRTRLARGAIRYLKPLSSNVFGRHPVAHLNGWMRAAEDIEWIRPPSVMLDRTNSPFDRWFPDGTLNTCYNAVDRHVLNGRGNDVAIIYDSPVTNVISKITYSELYNAVSRFTGVLKALGVVKGDVVVIYMPMMADAVIAMLACARIGAVHSVVFGGFAAPELAHRINDSKAKVVLTTSCGIDNHKIINYKDLVDKAIEISKTNGHAVSNCVVLQRPQLIAKLHANIDIDWGVAVDDVNLVAVSECTEMASSDPLYLLYTSGTTSAPKGILRDNGGHAVALKWAMFNVFGMKPRDVFWAASDIGWVVGHSFSVYAPLLQGCTTVIYEGKPVGTPNAGAFWRVISQHKVNGFFTAPTALRAIRLHDHNGHLATHYDMSSLRHMFLAGERADADSISWAEKVLNVPVLDNWWQTETGWPICGKG